MDRFTALETTLGLTGEEVPDGGGLGLPPADDGRGLGDSPAAGLQVAVHRAVALRGAAGPDKYHVSPLRVPRDLLPDGRVSVDGLRVAAAAQPGLHGLLHQVDEEEARAEHQLGQELNTWLQTCGRGLTMFRWRI